MTTTETILFERLHNGTWVHVGTAMIDHQQVLQATPADLDAVLLSHAVVTYDWDNVCFGTAVVNGLQYRWRDDGRYLAKMVWDKKGTPDDGSRHKYSVG